MDPTLIDAAALAIARRNMRTVNRSEICQMLKLDNPGPDTPHEKAMAMNLAFMGPMDQLKIKLLVDYDYALNALGSNGDYRRVPPAEQADWAQQKYRDAVNREFAKAGLRIKHVDASFLDINQRQERITILNRLAKLRGMFRKRKLD